MESKQGEGTCNDGNNSLDDITKLYLWYCFYLETPLWSLYFRPGLELWAELLRKPRKLCVDRVFYTEEYSSLAFLHVTWCEEKQSLRLQRKSRAGQRHSLCGHPGTMRFNKQELQVSSVVKNDLYNTMEMKWNWEGVCVYDFHTQIQYSAVHENSFRTNLF